MPEDVDEESSEADNEHGWLADDFLSASDRTHRSAGLWAVDTVNANAWGGAVEYLRQSSADFIVVQECRVREKQCADKEDTARGTGWSLALEPCVITDADATSAGVAVGTRSQIGSAVPRSKLEQCNEVLRGRFRLRHVGAMCRGGFHLGSIYMHDSIGVMAKSNLDLLQEAAAELLLVRGGWIVGGDWNCTPDELEASGWLDLVGGAIHAPTTATCNDSVYDFFVVKRCFQHAVFSVRAVGDALCKPHSPVRLLLRSAPRCIMVRGLRRPKGFSAALPFGPQLERHADDPGEDIAADTPPAEVDLNAEYTRLVSSIESELSTVAGHTADQAEAHAGRAEGLSFVWRNACGDIATVAARCTPVSWAWRRIANWLGDIRRAGVQSHTAAAARRRLLRYDHKLPNSAEAAQLQAWLGLLTPEMLSSTSWVLSLGQTATLAAERAEAEATKAARLAWTSWLHDGPAHGLRRQHRMSRTAMGWTPAPVSTPDHVNFSDADVSDELDEADLDVVRPQNVTAAPLSVQQIADKEAGVWAAEWGVGLELPQVVWPDDLGPLPPPLQLVSLRRALASFPCATGLGWDDLHPRALLRLPDVLLAALLRILSACECQGEWPRAVAFVVIALLPKPDGGRRPIGLFPWMPRIWMRLRREVAREWERIHDRSYLYAGVGKGADVAAWKQAARAELAHTLPGIEYGQALLDLVKAFERVPHHVLVREAVRLGYNLWVLRLALAAYRLGRVLRVHGAISWVVYALRGITAGSGLATTEMRVLLIHIVDSACVLYPAVTPTLFVDDLSAEVSGTRRYVLRHLIPFVLYVCDRMTESLLEVSRKKSVCTASSAATGIAIQRGLLRFAVRYVDRVKSLGSGLGAGTRRNARVTAGRLRAFQLRLPRFRRLRAAGVSTARLLRTGGVAAMTFGQSVVGVAPSLLLQQRRAAAAAAAPANGACGQSMDLALVIADESLHGKADPAFAAHLGPIGAWAQAVWEQWMPSRGLTKLVATAKARLARAKSAWSCVYGPAAAFVATAERLGWTVLDAHCLTTDAGRALRLDLDPPVVVARECEAAVRRWRWRSVEKAFPSLDSRGAGHGPNFDPVLALLRPAPDKPHWTAEHRGALRSAVLGRQWPQTRCFAAGFSQHNRCCLCLEAAIAEHRVAGIEDLDADVLAAVPVGSLLHRVAHCPAHRAARSLYAPLEVRCPQSAEWDVAACTRALVPSIAHVVPSPSAQESFSWIVRPPHGTARARFYTDGSRLDGPTALLARNGWAFVAIDNDGEVVASARGVPPPWIVDIPGTEAWALLQAAMVAEPGSDYRLDCLPCVDAIKSGKAWATSAARPLARVFNLLFSAIDDTPPEAFVWMPSHCGVDEVGRVRIGDGTMLSEIDRISNDLADTHAKEAVEEHRVPEEIRQRVRDEARRVREIAMWLGRVTCLAGGDKDGGRRRDSEASRRRAGHRRDRGRVRKDARGQQAALRPGPRLLACLEPMRRRIAARVAARRCGTPGGGAAAGEAS